MPRQARLDIPDLLHHVIVRGIKRDTIICEYLLELIRYIHLNPLRA